ncbi:hypothetical protein IRJ41_006459 [Triplophysa rosa]|uniref:Uncharacterized protein n=1 Tax=Triplophysa rosa TaxID=992332 RepID=A0A9W7TLG3_TRIRA|nr:hypothetical protein IRJ41_006459 [Triplophysa rosa]
MSRSHGYEETAKSKEELKYNCTEGLDEIPLNYAVESSAMTWMSEVWRKVRGRIKQMRDSVIGNEC